MAQILIKPENFHLIHIGHPEQENHNFGPKSSLVVAKLVGEEGRKGPLVTFQTWITQSFGGPPGQPAEDKALGSGSIGPSHGDLPPENINFYKERKQKYQNTETKKSCQISWPRAMWVRIPGSAQSHDSNLT